eukprot:Nitzschia sp. Nitz4//scaffold61_size107673//4994//7225//NITZ4_004219-RA/size107673-processed-gene-0.149-mRNA-1//1//CDS//3329555662//6173//frame0
MASTGKENEFGIPEGCTLEPSAQSSLASLQFPPNGNIAVSKKSLLPGAPAAKNYLVVGRQAATCDIRISQKSLSRQHALLFYTSDGELNIMDLADGETSKTMVNGKHIAPKVATKLQNGDTIQWAKKVQPIFTVSWERTNVSSGDKGNLPTDVALEGQPIEEVVAKPDPLEGLTGRARRQAEIEAMMASLDEKPTYTKTTIKTENNDAKEQQPEKVRRDRKVLAAVSKHKLPLTDATDEATFDSSNVLSTIAMDPSGARFAVASMDSSLRLYDFGGFNADNPTPFTNVYVQEGYPIRSIAYSPTGDRFLVATASSQPRVMNRDGEEVLEFVRGDMYVRDPQQTTGHTSPLTCVAWHPVEHSIVFTTSHDGSLKVWNVDKGKLAFGMLKCLDTVLIKSVQTGRKTIPTSLTLSPKQVVLGTSCGSVQIYSYPFTSKLRPQQSTTVLEGKEPIVCVHFSADATRLACRTTNSVVVYNCRGRLSTSSTPLLTVHNVGTIDSDCATPTMAFSPSGRVICIGVHDDKRVDRSRLDFYLVPREEKEESRPNSTTTGKLLCSCSLDSTLPVVSLSWHLRLNQILVATTKTFQVWYSSDHSQKGVLLTAGRRRKRKMEDDLQDVYRVRAPPPGSAVRQEQIITPNALPLFAEGDAQHFKRRSKHDKLEEESKRQHPQQPAKSVYNTHNTIFAQMVVDNQTVDQKVIAGKDPREALAKYSEGKSYIGTAYEGNKERILAEKTVEEEEDDMKK